MGCGCNKNKQNQQPVTEGETPVSPNLEFRKESNPQDVKGLLSRKIGMVQSFASALVSRGLSDQKINKSVKQLRAISCFGNKHLGGQLPPCEYLKDSETPGKFFCGGCGCGDKKGTWLISDSDSYSKLDYPKLNCPLQMPGFTNYKESTPDEAVSPITRRYYVENISYRELEKISVTLHGAPIDPKKTAPNP